MVTLTWHVWEVTWQNVHNKQLFFFKFKVILHFCSCCCCTVQFLIADRLYSAILRSLEQTYCVCRWCYMSD